MRGREGLKGISQRPLSSTRRTPEEVEQRVLEARRKTDYGRKRLAWYLARGEGIILSPHTLRPKYILDKGTLLTKLWTHILRKRSLAISGPSARLK